MVKKAILVIPARLGDAIFTTPAIAFLSKHLPEMQFDILAPTPLAAEVFQAHPRIGKIHVSQNAAEIAALGKTYTLAFNFHRDRITDAAMDALNLPTMQVAKPAQAIHQADQALEMAASYVNREVLEEDRRYQLFPQAEHEQKIAALLKNHGVEKQTLLIGMHLGCRGIAKKSFWRTRASATHEKVWSLGNFIQVARLLFSNDPQRRIVVTGSGTEALLADAFMDQIPTAINLINQTSVLETAALMRFLQAYLTGDTGPLHIASAMGVPLLALFGPTSVSRVGPYPKAPQRVVLQAENITDLSVSNVFQALQSLMRK